LFYAIEAQHNDMLRWLLAQGFDLVLTDQFGTPALSVAAQADNLEAVRLLLDAGMDPDATVDHTNALYGTGDPAIARILLDAGADPARLSQPLRRALVGLPPDASRRRLSASDEEFHRACHRRFGTTHPEQFDEPFWTAMLLSGESALAARGIHDLPVDRDDAAVWCAQRYGQSLTFLPDGRIIQVCGEHEDGYDPDFCIYNDVFVHGTEGSVRIFGYPEADFPPTDFHTATLVSDRIYLIGRLGYSGTRAVGTTPLFALDTRNLRIDPVVASGDPPGWIYQHRARFEAPDTIVVFGGKRVVLVDGIEQHVANDAVHVLDLTRMHWRQRHRSTAGSPPDAG
jgi:hypothetical protein